MPERIGFIGTGTITEAIIDGLAATPAPPTEIHVSPRNADIAARLASKHAFVRVARENQHVLDECDVVCLAVRPQIAEGVLAELKFSPRHHVLSFVATYRLERLRKLLPGVAHLARLAPLPMVARKLGTTIVHPKDPVAAALFNSIGMALETDDEADFDVLCAATALMGGFFAMLDAQAGWLQGKGIDPDVARNYLAALYFGLSSVAKETETSYTGLAREFSTLGGLNEQVINDLAGDGVFKSHAHALDRILERISKV
jgi:pyrroline-5-carboxylate reductase